MRYDPPDITSKVGFMMSATVVAGSSNAKQGMFGNVDLEDARYENEFVNECYDDTVIGINNKSEYGYRYQKELFVSSSGSSSSSNCSVSSEETNLPGPMNTLSSSTNNGMMVTSSSTPVLSMSRACINGKGNNIERHRMYGNILAFVLVFLLWDTWDAIINYAVYEILDGEDKTYTVVYCLANVSLLVPSQPVIWEMRGVPNGIKNNEKMLALASMMAAGGIWDLLEVAIRLVLRQGYTRSLFFHSSALALACILVVCYEKKTNYDIIKHHLVSRLIKKSREKRKQPKAQGIFLLFSRKLIISQEGANDILEGKKNVWKFAGIFLPILITVVVMILFVCWQVQIFVSFILSFTFIRSAFQISIVNSFLDSFRARPLDYLLSIFGYFACLFIALSIKKVSKQSILAHQQSTFLASEIFNCYLLEKINIDHSLLSRLPCTILPKLCREIREKLIDSVFQTGGHLGSNLGVVEITLAIHYVFNLPDDKLLFDVSHQSYPHKMITGRLAKFNSLRKRGGISGFVKRGESDFDVFGAGHSSTAISAGVGFAISRDLRRASNFIICLVGDGGLTGGISFEGLNNAGHMNLKKFLVILNDNEQVSLPTEYNEVIESVGALSRTLRKASETKPSFFNDLGFQYEGPFDGHDVLGLVSAFRRIRMDLEIGTRPRPVLIHVRTIKGKGHSQAEKSKDKLHAVSEIRQEISMLEPCKRKKSFSEIFGETLTQLAMEDERIIAITAAMPGGTGLEIFQKKIPSRMIDVGISEQHAVTCAAALAIEGFKPFVAIYSTFIQRAIDQVIHDVAIQNLPVRFILDRAGFVGADGATHQGIYDISLMRCVPNMRLCAPSDGHELIKMINLLAQSIDYPIAIRFPRGTTSISQDSPDDLALGKSKVVYDWPAGGEGKRTQSVALVSYGACLQECLQAAEMLKQNFARIRVVDARWCKPLDEEEIVYLADNVSLIVTIEEGSCGGFSGAVSELLLNRGALDTGQVRLRSIYVPDLVYEHDTQQHQKELAGIVADRIVAEAIKAVLTTNNKCL